MAIEALVNTWDDYIENLLPLGISNLFLFDGEQVKELAEQEVPPPIVVDAIRTLLGLELAEKLAVDIEILVNRKRKEIAEKQDLDNLEEIEQKIKQLQEEFNRQQQKLTSLQAELKLSEQEEQEAVDKFLSEGGKIAAERTHLEQQKQEVTTEAEAIRQTMCESAADVLPLALIQPLLTQVQAQGETEFRTRQAQIAQDIILERDKRLIDLISKLEIENQKMVKIKSFLEEDETRRNTNLQKQQPWLLADDEALSQLGNVIYYLYNAKNSVKQQLLNLKTKEEEVINIERQMQTAASPEEYEQLRDVMRKAQQKVAEAKASCETSRRHLMELETTIEKCKKDLKEYTEQTIDRKNREHVITASAKVQETLKLFRERLTLRKLNKLENEITECFRYLLHKSDLVHRIVIDTNSFSLSLFDLQGKQVPKHRLSAGEKQLLAIAFLWGLARVSGLRLPVAIDTPLGRLDSSHRSNLVERYFPCASYQVILLSTDTEIGEKEVKTLRENEAIAREYLLKYDSSTRQTSIEPGYFW